MTDATIHFKLLVPAELRLDNHIVHLRIEALDGSRVLLPRHQDFFTALPTGIVSYRTNDDKEHFIAIDQGLLVKCAEQVTLTAHHAILSDTLKDLRTQVRDRFVDVDEQQKHARSALARLEAGAIRQFINLEHLQHG